MFCKQNNGSILFLFDEGKHFFIEKGIRNSFSKAKLELPCLVVNKQTLVAEPMRSPKSPHFSACMLRNNIEFLKIMMCWKLKHKYEQTLLHIYVSLLMWVKDEILWVIVNEERKRNAWKTMFSVLITQTGNLGCIVS